MSFTTSSGVRTALQGQRVLVVGGDRRDQALARLRLGLALSDVAHCRTRKSDASPKCFESQIRHPGIVLVVWVLGLSRTHHGEHLHRLCREMGIPWIDCFRIPHPNALIARLVELRLGDALAARRSARGVATVTRRHPIGGAA